MLRPASPDARDGRKTSDAQAGVRDDRELMRRVLADDAEAFSAIYDRHAGSVLALAHRMLRERSAAEDVAQEAFVALWRSRHSYRPERGSPGTWLLTITRNRSIDAIRRGRAHLHTELDTELDQEAPERTDEEALRRVEATTVGAALRALSDAQRQALELSYFEGFSQTEIAARLGLPLGTVKSRMRLGLRRLATQLSPQTAALHPRRPSPVSHAHGPAP